jgi:histidyl-tRNA synthetase
LDYYTGVIFETTLDQLPSIGSVCSGGRYDNLAGVYTKQHLPGIGASLGLDRLLAAMEALELLPDAATPAPVFIAYFDRERRDDYLRLASMLRNVGIPNELYPDPKKLGVQLKYADNHGFRVALIAGANEWSGGQIQVKTLATKESAEVAYSHQNPEELVQRLNQILANEV